VSIPNLTKDPLPGLLAHLAIPASLGYLFQTMFNVVDTYFAGQVSTDALAALSISFPVFFLIIAVSSGIGTGTTACIAHALGANNQELARRFAEQSILYTLAASAVITALGWFACPAIFRFLGAEHMYLELSVSYMRTLFIGAVFFLMASGLKAPLSATGDTKSFRNVLIAGALLNVGLDPLLMYGWGPFPALGFRGIAISSVAIEAGAVVYLAVKAWRTPLLSSAIWTHCKPCGSLQSELNRNILPACMNMLTVGIGIFIITWFISGFGQEAVAAYGIATRVEQIVLLPGIGLGIAVLTLSGQNTGAGLLDRVRDVFSLSVRYGFYLMVAGGCLIWLCRESFMGLFSSDPTVIQHGTDYLLVAAGSLWAYIILFNGSSTLQGMKRPMFAIWMGLTRQIALPCLLFPLLSKGFGLGLWGIWIGIVAIAWVAAGYTGWYVRHKIRQECRSLESSSL